MDGDIGGDAGGGSDDQPYIYGANPWFLLFVSVAGVIGTVQAIVQGQPKVALLLGAITLVLFGMTYVFFDRRRDS